MGARNGHSSEFSLNFEIKGCVIDSTVSLESISKSVIVKNGISNFIRDQIFDTAMKDLCLTSALEKLTTGFSVVSFLGQEKVSRQFSGE
jgi:hypothetical protein